MHRVRENAVIHECEVKCSPLETMENRCDERSSAFKIQGNKLPGGDRSLYTYCNLHKGRDDERGVIRFLLLEELPRTLRYNETYPLPATLRVAPSVIHSHLLFLEHDHLVSVIECSVKNPPNNDKTPTLKAVLR